MANKILIVDDEADIRLTLRDFLELHGYEVNEADSGRAAEESFRTARPDAVLLDYLLSDSTALELLPRLKEIDPEVPLLILTAHGSIGLAVQAVKDGAEQFLTKPVALPALLVILQRLLENQRNRRKQLAGKSRQGRDAIDPFGGSSAVIRHLAAEARKILVANSPVLLQGETGTGKGVLARWLHDNGPRAEEAFVDLNCAGLSRELLETELFGHEKGAFTDAIATKVGLLEVAHGGTMFLDEMGDMDLQVQPKLLKVLEEQRFRRVGDVRDRQVALHLIVATHQDLQQLVQEKKFRLDLYFRISTIPLRLPALRERVEDIPVLARALLERLAAEVRRGDVSLAPAAERALQEYQWPGNIRELRNVLERALLLTDHQVLGPKELQFGLPVMTAGPSEGEELSLLALERRRIEQVLREEHGHIERAARRLGIPRSSLYSKIQRHRIRVSKV